MSDPTSYTVLIIDDNPDHLDLARIYLKDPALDVVTACGGAEGLAMARRQPPDLVLLDLMMPEMDGFQVLEQMRADPRTAAARVIVFSAKDGLDDVRRVVDLGAIDYVTKPIAIDTMRSKVEKCLGIRLAPPPGTRRRPRP
ncbi:MAG: response regulator [Planctomycetes bacterium]|nr:response regulator [Planctomycetota bacterium]